MQPTDPPKYPGADYYRELAARGPVPPPGYTPPAAPTSAPRLTPIAPQYAPPGVAQPGMARGHTAFSRFVIAWGGWNRLWIFLGTGILSAIVYTYLWGNGDWGIGIGLVALICIHEFGHAFALRIKRLRATFPIFIPGIGAFVTLPNQPISLRDDAEISLAGPLLGGVASLACLLIFAFTATPSSQTYQWWELAFYGFFLNALNLIPVLPLDGGHIGRTLSRYFPIVGLAIIALLYFTTQNFFFLLIGFYGLSDVMQSFNSPVRQVAMRTHDRAVVFVMYGVVAALLLLGVWATDLNSFHILSVLRFLRPDLFHS
jgi:Zn-dependent protease